MIGNRVMFGFIPLFLALVITISTAPIPDKQLVSTKLVEKITNETITTTESVTYEDDSNESDEKSNEQDIESTTVEYKEETTIVPEVVTNGFLFADTTEISLNIDEIMKITDDLLSETQVELPTTSTTESPKSTDSDE